jgi:hypothetical protein
MKCKNVLFHDYEFTPTRYNQKVCHLPECDKDRHNRATRKNRKSHSGEYLWRSERLDLRRKKGEGKPCESPWCNNLTTNRFGICNTCRTSLLSGVDPNFVIGGSMRHNGNIMMRN